jgi:hypothetical protein
MSQGTQTPPPGPLHDLVARVAADVKMAYTSEVVAAFVALKRADPGAAVVLYNELKRIPDFIAGEFNRLVNVEWTATSSNIADPADTATRLVQLSEAAIEHFIGEGSETVYATFEFKGRIETTRIQDGLYGHWLRMAFYDETGRSPNSEALKNARSTIEARAFKEGTVHQVHNRIAHHNGKTYIDRNSAERDVIEVDADGYRMLEQSPVKFLRSPDRGVLPIPQPGGSINDLKPFLNLYEAPKTRGGNRVKDRDFKLVVATILGCFIPDGEFPFSLLFGPHGSSKTTTLKRIFALVDPVLKNPSGSPREDREVLIVARNTFLQANDNVKYYSAERQATLCRLSSGGSDQGRELFTTMDTFNISVARPTVATSTIVVVTESDLSDRMILIRTGLSFDDPDNKQLKRKTRAELDAAFAVKWPQLFGCILTAVSHGLRNAGQKPTADLPRLADLAVWTWQCEPGLGWTPGTILEAYQEMVAEAAEDLVELDPVAAATYAFMADLPEWRGTMTDLLVQLTRKVPVRVTKTKDWPLNGAVLSRRLRALSTILHPRGLALRWGHDADGNRIFHIVRTDLPVKPNGEDHASQPSPDPEAEPTVEDTTGGIQL